MAISAPANGSTLNPPSWTNINGTASDALAGLNTVQYSVRQGAGNYWNGTSFGSASEVLLTATGTTTWSATFAFTNFPASGLYTVRAVANDLAGQFSRL